jgi:hypothetical protein
MWILSSFSLIFALLGLFILVITLWSLSKPVYIIDRAGNWYRGLIRQAQNVPNNGMLYSYMYKRKNEITLDEKHEWIHNNKELYADIQNQMRSRPPYDKVMVRVR